MINHRKHAMQYYLSRFWLAISVSFYLFVPYLTRYTDEANRFSFHWTQRDLMALLFCIVLVGAFFFLSFILLYDHGGKTTKKVFEFSFIAAIAVALIANSAQPVKLLLKNTPSYITIIERVGFLAWFFLGIASTWVVFFHAQRSKMLCMALCFIVSPIIPIFTFNALRYKTFIANKGSLPILSATERQNLDGKSNVYIFIFDEWSYQRSFSNKELIKDFRNLKQCADKALVFHNATSPRPHTFASMPAFLFQTNLRRFTVKGEKLGFGSKNFYPLHQAENIFQHARELNFYTAMVGSDLPYGELLEDSVDFCNAICGYKRFGDSFFDVAKYHLLTAALLLPALLFHHERNLIAHYYFNRFQINQINTTHKLFRAIVQNQSKPTFAVFHYMIPHFPYIFNRSGPKKLFAIHNGENDYYDNLAYLDEKIGEIIAVLKESNKFENSLIIMTSDHGWRFDPDYDKTNRWWIFERLHVPLFIKMPSQDRSLEIDSKFNTFMLGNFINKYLDGDFTLSEVQSLLSEEKYFIPDPLKLKTQDQPFLKEIDVTTCKNKLGR